MRISIDPSDLGYREDSWRFKVTIDGEQAWRVITADDDLGMVLRFKCDATGMFFRDAHDQPVRERVFGRVRINLRAVYGFG